MYNKKECKSCTKKYKKMGKTYQQIKILAEFTPDGEDCNKCYKESIFSDLKHTPKYKIPNISQVYHYNP